jgi:g-D-glutamyl-meso-diaminopimelate peptidase
MRDFNKIFILLVLFLQATTIVFAGSNTSVLAELERNNVNPIVNTTKQHYGYNEMLEDLALLADKYPQCIRRGSLTGKSFENRDIPFVYFGNPKAEKFVLVQASMHAREYMSTILVMSMLERYASEYDHGTFKERRIKDIFNKVGFVIIPMLNPDGVEISQRGVEGALTPEVKQWVINQTKLGKSHVQIKSNANGVDLNRNFTNGFGKARNASRSKAYEHYMGPSPYSESETCFLLEVSTLHNYSLFLNYHTRGNLVYYGCKNAPTRYNDVNQKSLIFSQIVKRHTQYPLYGPQTSPPNGSWADEVETLYEIPSVTIELGTKNPVPINEFNGLFKKNLWVWADIAIEVLENKALEFTEHN